MARGHPGARVAGPVRRLDAGLDEPARIRRVARRRADAQPGGIAPPARAGRGAQGRGRRRRRGAQSGRTGRLTVPPPAAPGSPGTLAWVLAPDAPTALGASTHLWWIPGADDAPPRARRGRIDALLRAVLVPYVGMAPDALRFARE